MHYKKLLSMSMLSFIAMFILMYLMVDTYANVYININQFYMAGIMTIPMILIELWLMGAMYTNKKLNTIIIFSSITIFGVLILCMRKQTAVNDQAFLKSMIPHHAAALLMCKEAQLQDPELKQLCENIRRTQRSEIDFMKSKLR